MNKRNLIGIPVAAMLIAAATAFAGTEKPNIVLILADDQGWNALSTRIDPDEPGSGSTYYQTPRLTKLAEDGMRFSQAYSPAPTCSPTRHAIQFGRSPASLKRPAASARAITVASSSCGHLVPCLNDLPRPEGLA